MGSGRGVLSTEGTAAGLNPIVLWASASLGRNLGSSGRCHVGKYHWSSLAQEPPGAPRPVSAPPAPAVTGLFLEACAQVSEQLPGEPRPTTRPRAPSQLSWAGRRGCCAEVGLRSWISAQLPSAHSPAPEAKGLHQALKRRSRILRSQSCVWGRRSPRAQEPLLTLVVCK